MLSVGTRDCAMKFLSLFIVLLIVMGCVGPAKFTIPDEPKFRPIHATVFEEGICFEKKELETFVNNIRMLKAYADELRLIKLTSDYPYSFLLHRHFKRGDLLHL